MKRQFYPASAFVAALAAASGLVAGCASSGPGRAGAPVPAPDVSPEAAREAALRALADVTAERFPDADSAAVFQWEETQYEADGTYVTTWTSIDKILTDRGLEKSQSVSLWNNDFYGSITVLVARVRSPDGTTRDVDLAENLAEAVDTSSLSSNIHDPDDKTWTLAFPGLEVGDAVETTMRRTVRRARCEGVYADWLAFEQTGPVLWQGVRIEGPAERPLRSRAFRDPGPVALAHRAATNAATGRISETWVARDTPRYFPEPDMPPAHECTARLLLSTAPDWESLSRWYAGLCAPHLAATNAAMAELVAARAVPGDREATVRALFDFVSREVRYMGAMAESEAPGYEPHDVSLTFGNRYGVCRDKAALLVSLLRMAGFDAWPTLVHVGERKDPDVPQPYFNHAIVAAASGDPDDPYLLMDPTSETTRSLLPEYLCEKSYLVAREEGDSIRETPPLPADGNLVRADTVVRFAEDGGASLGSEIRFAGINDAAYRGHFASIPRDSIRAYCQRLLSIAAPGAVLTDWSLSPDPADLRTDLSPLVLRLSCELPTAASDAGPDGRVPFDPPRFAEAFAIASRVVGDLGLEKRRFDLVTDYPCGFEETVSFEGAEPEETPPTGVSTPAAEYSDSTRGGTVRRSLKLLRSRFSPDEYAALRRLREAEERAGRAPLFLRLAGGAPTGAPDGAERLAGALSRAVRPDPQDDACLESRRVVVDLSDMPGSWTVTTSTRIRILTYAGQRRESDTSVEWQPAVEDVELLDARTISPDGSETAVDPALDVFDADQDWVADAPRYPAGRLRTVSFPKVEPGCAVARTFRRRHHGGDFLSFSATLGRLGAFDEDSVEVRGPEKWRRAFFLREPVWPGLAGTNAVERIDGPDSTTWRLRGGGPGSTAVRERNMPDADRLFPSVEASEQTVEDRARAIRDAFLALSDPAAETNAAALARSLVPDGAGEADKVRAIRDWTDLNLRAAGPAWTSLPLAALSHADETLAARYGHAADRRILQLAMARALGLRVSLRFRSPGWAGGGARTRGEKAVRPGTISSVAVVVRPADPDAPPLFLDGASRFAPLPFERDADMPYFEFSETDPETGRFVDPGLPEPAFDPRDPAAEAVDSVERTYDCALRSDGSAAVSVRIRYRGDEAEAFRRKYAQMLPEERRRNAQKLAAAFSQSARLAGDVAASHPDGGPCELSFALDVPDFAVPRGDRLVLRLERAVLSPEAAPRVFPFSRDATLRERVETVLRLPPGWRVESAPSGHDPWIDPEFGIVLLREASREETAEGGEALRVADTLCLGPAEFPASRYPEFLAGELETRAPAAETVVLAPVGGSARQPPPAAPQAASAP